MQEKSRKQMTDLQSKEAKDFVMQVSFAASFSKSGNLLLSHKKMCPHVRQHEENADQIALVSLT